jgi:hypothetical protein
MLERWLLFIHEYRTSDFVLTDTHPHYKPYFQIRYLPAPGGFLLAKVATAG